MIFDTKVRSDEKRVEYLFSLSSGFGLLYPILAGLFFNSGVIVQGLLVLVFFALRATYEYAADAMTAKTFGSDAMPVVNFAGVCMHEICLSFMMTNINHRLMRNVSRRGPLEKQLR